MVTFGGVYNMLLTLDPYLYSQFAYTEGLWTELYSACV